ncbi:anti-repressor SinI family protein [Paenibacillus sp. BSR1-1]|nr:anti-repressor SinI family protein [Paenibacillus sp. BSR1-1]MDN3017628.1 anti-repressor SinI family protein [Paenibacillus sp. BSR1-1]
MVITERKLDVIDEEWLGLILEAKELGLSLEEVREFLNQSQVKELIAKNI